MTILKTPIKGSKSSSQRRKRNLIARAKGLLKVGPSSLKVLMDERKREVESEKG